MLPVRVAKNVWCHSSMLATNADIRKAITAHRALQRCALGNVSRQAQKQQAQNEISHKVPGLPQITVEGANVFS